MRCFSILCPETANPVLRQKEQGVPVILANERCVEMRNDTLVQVYYWCPASGHNSRKDSATGTRTRVAQVRAEYPNQLDYSGFCAGHAAAFNKILACSTRRWGLRPLISHTIGNCHGLPAAMRHISIRTGNEAREIRAPNLLIWSQTRCRCTIAP